MRNGYLKQYVLCACLTLVATPAWADDSWYMSIRGGIGGGADADILETVQTIDTEVGPVIMGAVGVPILDGVRVEGEISWRKNDGDSHDTSLENLAFMLNGIHDFQHPEHPDVTPYILLGFGVSVVEGESTILAPFGDIQTGPKRSESEAVFAYQGGAGLAWHITKHVAFDLSYRYFGTAEPEISVDLDVNNTHHNGLVGLTFSF